MFAAAMFLALVIEGIIGWPNALFDRVGHPITWMGALIDACDRRFNRATDRDLIRRLAGALVTLGLCALVWAAAALLVWLLPGGWLGALLTGVLAWPLVAARSLHDHVRAVVLPLARGNLEGARQAVSMIVGRDPAWLDEAGVSRAALESLGESTSDGVVAPLFWGVILGLPGIATYKMINTMDSMIGHLSPRHAAFGWAAARLDDLVNLIPARLSGLFYVAVAGQHRRAALNCMLRDAGKHRSPNAGWPEAALAGALGVRLSGPRVYDGERTNEPWVNDGAPDPAAMDLGRGLVLYLKSITLLAGVLVGLALIWR